MPVEFSCEHCDRSIRVRDDLAGKRVKCPGCSETVSVPEEDQPAPAKRSAAKAEKPAPAPRSRGRDDDDDDDDDRPRKRSSRDDEDEADRPRRRSHDDDEDDGRSRRRSSRDDEDDDRPRRRSSRDDDRDDDRPRRSSRDDDDEDDRDRKPAKKKAGGSWVPLILGISGGVVGLLLVCVLLFWLFGGGGGALTPWVPGDGESFSSVRLADLWKSSQVQEAIKKNQGMFGGGGGRGSPEDRLEKELGLKITEIDRLTNVRYSGSSWTVVETVSAYDQAKLRDKLTDGKEEAHEGKKYFKGKAGGQCIHFASSNLFVMGNEAGLKMALSVSANRKSGPLDDGLSLISSGRQFVSATKTTGVGGGKIMGMEIPTSQASYASISGNWVTTYQIMAYEDTAKATAAKAAMDELAKKFKDVAEKMPAGKGGKRVVGSVSQSGNKIYIQGSMELDPDQMGGFGMGFMGGFGM